MPPRVYLDAGAHEVVFRYDGSQSQDAIVALTQGVIQTIVTTATLTEAILT